MDGSSYLTDEVRAYAVTGDRTHYDNYWNEINVLKNRDIGVAQLIQIGITPAEQEKVDAMSALSNNLVPLESDAMDLTMAGNTDAAIEAVYGADYYQTIGQIQSIKAEFLTMLDQRAETEVNKLISQAQAAQMFTIFFVIIVAALQIINVVTVMKKTIVPIRKLQKEMEEIAVGNLSSRFELAPDTSEIGRLTQAIIALKAEFKKYIDDVSNKLKLLSEGNLDLAVTIDYKGDFAPIKDAFIKILSSLNDTLSQINTVSQQVSNGARQIAEGSQGLAEGSGQQQESVRLLSNTVSGITAQTAHNAEMAKEAVELAILIKNNADTIKISAQTGTDRMSQMTETVRDINEANEQISQVMEMIDSITSQTNLLALNAAIEAARAGEHGKGFAVVAEEVRNLASKSAEAARDSRQLIANSIEKARHGLDLATETSGSLQDIVTEIEKSAAGIEQSVNIIQLISDASAAQANAASQLNTGIEQVEDVVRQNSAGAQESAAAAEEMSGQSLLLENLASQFKLKARQP